MPPVGVRVTIIAGGKDNSQFGPVQIATKANVGYVNVQAVRWPQSAVIFVDQNGGSCVVQSIRKVLQRLNALKCLRIFRLRDIRRAIEFLESNIETYYDFSAWRWVVVGCGQPMRDTKIGDGPGGNDRAQNYLASSLHHVVCTVWIDRAFLAPNNQLMIQNKKRNGTSR